MKATDHALQKHDNLIRLQQTPGEGTFSSEFQVPFVGVYAAVNSGPVSLDAQVRWDAYRGTLTDNKPLTGTNDDATNQGVYGQLLSANALTFLWNAAYRHDVKGRNWFIEPSIGGIWSRTSVDPFNVSGNFVIDSSATLTPPGTARVDDIDTLLGRASIRAGTTIVNAGVAYQPFATASVFHEFAGSVRAHMSGDYNQLGFVGTTTGESETSRVGTYGHIGLGLAGVILDTGWVGYLRGDYRFGDNIEGISVNAGVRYHFTPEKTPGMKDGHSGHHKMAVNWTGPYVGLFGGGLFSQTEWDEAAGNIGPRASGGIIGGQIGYNWQIGHLVLGPELDWGITNADGSNGCPGTVDISGTAADRQFFFNCHSKIEQLALLTGRIGHTWDRALLYLKGGVAIGEVDNRSKFNLGDTPLFFAPDPRDTSGGQTKTMVGWALGGGIEYKLTERWSAKGEYMHFDLGSEKFLVDSAIDVNAGVKGDTVRIGVNYNFGHRGSHDHHEPVK